MNKELKKEETLQHAALEANADDARLDYPIAYSEAKQLIRESTQIKNGIVHLQTYNINLNI